MGDFYTAEQLNAMGIFQLRDLARKLGHHSPTDKRKQELIEFILTAKEAPVQSEETGKKRRGRPPKNMVEVPVPELVKPDANGEKIDEKQPNTEKDSSVGRSHASDIMPYDASGARAAGVRFTENGFEPRKKYDQKHTGNNGYFNGKHDKNFYDSRLKKWKYAKACSRFAPTDTDF